MILKIVLLAALAVAVTKSQSPTTDLPTPAPAADEVPITPIEVNTKPLEADASVTISTVLSDEPAAVSLDSPDLHLIGTFAVMP